MKKWEDGRKKISENLHWLQKRVRNFDLSEYGAYDESIIIITRIVWEPVYGIARNSIFNNMSSLTL